MEYRDKRPEGEVQAGTGDNAALQNSLRSAAVQQGLAIRFEGDGTARITAAGCDMEALKQFWANERRASVPS